MLKHYRRFWILIAACMLAAPLAVSVAAPDWTGDSANELRPLAPTPAFPRNFDEWIKYPQQVNAFLTDHFGLRQSLIRADAVLRHYYLDSGNDLVFIGRDGALFYRGERLLQSSSGIDLHPGEATEVADMLAAMHSVLSSRGVKFLVASPPNSATIYPERLPTWLRADGKTTQYDLFLAALAKNHTPVVDLRPSLLQAKSSGKLYWKYDSHWTPRGALVGFNAIVMAAGLSDWVIDPAKLLGPDMERSNGDLARLLDLTDWLRESGPTIPRPFVASYQQLTPQPFAAFSVTARHPGPTVLVIGDSFTGGLFTPLVVQKAGRFIWMHHESCGFDWKWIDELRPDIVWYMPTERTIPCWGGRRPKGMPAATASNDKSPAAVFGGHAQR